MYTPEPRAPHDAFFKETFGQTEVAADFLRHYLHNEVYSLLQLEKLEAQRDSFVDPDLQEQFSDLLYRVPLTSGDTAYVYTLFEHKSYPDKLVAFQLLRYLLRIWERSLRQEQSLPPIIPIVLYHGTTHWQLNPRFDALFAGPEALRIYWPSFAFEFTDLSHLSDDKILGEVLLRAALLLLKYIRDERLGEQLVGIMQLLADWQRQESGLQWLYTFLRYVTAAGQQVSEAELRQIVESVAAQRGSVIMATIAQQWIEQGIEQGREEGREEGAQVIRDSILTILRMRFPGSDPELDALARRLQEISNLQQLADLNLHALQEPSLESYWRRLS